MVEAVKINVLKEEKRVVNGLRTAKTVIELT